MTTWLTQWTAQRPELNCVATPPPDTTLGTRLDSAAWPETNLNTVEIAQRSEPNCGAATMPPSTQTRQLTNLNSAELNSRADPMCSRKQQQEK